MVPIEPPKTMIYLQILPDTAGLKSLKSISSKDLSHPLLTTRGLDFVIRKM